jgi:hypothetical protein
MSTIDGAVKVANRLMRLFKDSIKTNRSLWLVSFLLIPIVLVALVSHHLRPDLSLYYRYSSSIVQGQIPYRDFPVEYPPLALLPMVLPQLLTGFVHSFRAYLIGLMVQNALLCSAVGLLVAKIAARHHSQAFSRRTLAIYSLFVVINAPLILLRFDILPALLTVLALWFVIIARPSLAGIALGLGIMTKLYPAVLVPVVGLYYVMKRQYADVLKLMGGSIVAVGVVLLPFIPIGLNRLLLVSQYHQARGLQLESIPAGLLLLAKRWGWTTVEIVTNYGALHLKSPIADTIAKALPSLFLICWALAILSCFKRLQLERHSNYATIEQTLLICIALVLLTFIVTSKVFSPQYLVWLLPFMPFLHSKQLSIAIAMCILTLVIFPFSYSQLIEMKLLPILLLNLRNLAIVSLTLGLMVSPFWLSTSRSKGAIQG